ncbi:MAG: ABC transporter ATP-binding protein [Bacteroidota bacterium]
MPAALTIENLSVGYLRGKHQQVLLQNLRLALQPGKLVCFMGSNGIGKSTLIRTLAGLQPPLAGHISQTTATDVALVLTDRVSALHMTVDELIAFGRYPYLNWSATLTAEDARILNEVVDLVHIRHLLGKRLYELSDGQLQMVMIARALAQRTPVILLDEPTAHLDLNNRLEVMNLLRGLTRLQNKAILVATHELDLALQTADEIWLATSNNTIVSGIPEDLVLNGAFDQVFQFKGFDLKTGKIHHEIHREGKIRLVGSGHEYLWTKNALERSGYEVVEQGGLEIRVQNGTWYTARATFHTIGALLHHLNDHAAQ